MFLIYNKGIQFTEVICAGFNPLNQVYVFNGENKMSKCALNDYEGFNPLNQVYVFN